MISTIGQPVWLVAQIASEINWSKISSERGNSNASSNGQLFRGKIVLTYLKTKIQKKMRGPFSDPFDRGGWPNMSVFMKTWSDTCEFLDDTWYEEQANCLIVTFFSSSSQ